LILVAAHDIHDDIKRVSTGCQSGSASSLGSDRDSTKCQHPRLGELVVHMQW
jgi:hypothetical protein